MKQTNRPTTYSSRPSCRCVQVLLNPFASLINSMLLSGISAAAVTPGCATLDRQGSKGQTHVMTSRPRWIEYCRVTVITKYRPGQASAC